MAGKTGMIDKLKAETGSVVRRWAATPYYDAVEASARAQWDGVILPFLGDAPISYECVLELAPGHGRMTQIMLEKAEKVYAVDPLQENIDFCANRFAGNAKVTLVRNDGVTLEAIPDASVTFMFCWDSMVHFDSDVVRNYLREAARVLKPGGFFFTHHSNYQASPGGVFQTTPHARNFMSVPLMKHYAIKEGLEPVRNQVIDWGRGDKRFAEHDGLALLRKPA